MTKFLDIFLIGALALNLFNTYNNYNPETEIFGTTIPTTVAVGVQVLCIVFLGYKVWKNYAADKSV